MWISKVYIDQTFISQRQWRNYDDEPQHVLCTHIGVSLAKTCRACFSREKDRPKAGHPATNSHFLLLSSEGLVHQIRIDHEVHL